MKNTARPVAYIRRSVVRRDNEGDLSREFQVAEVRRLAGEDGPSLSIIDGDWGRSAANDKTDKRLAFLAIMESIERGEVTILYAYALDRLARSVEWSARLLNACERAGTTIVTGEGSYAPGDDGARVTFHVLAAMNENAVRAMARKARATRERRDARGDRRGSPPYGWRIVARKAGEPVTWEPDPDQSVDAILAAYQTAGSFHGAARLLNERGTVAPRGSRWYGSRVRDILKSQRPDVAAVRQTTARVAHGSSSQAIFRRLLRCHCHGIPTPNRQRNGTYAYRCPKGHSDRAGHPVVQVPEHVIVEWAKVEAAHLRGIDPEYQGSDDEGRRAELLAQRQRIGRALILGVIEEPEAIAQRDAIDAELDGMDASQVLEAVQAIDWTWPPEALGVGLRALWLSIDLGPDMLPVRAEWRVKAWRA